MPTSHHHTVNESQLTRIIYASAWYDLITTAGFTFALSAFWLLSGLSWVFTQFGGQPLPEIAPVHMLFINFAGAVVSVWSVLRLKYVQSYHALFDTVARVLFSIAMFTFILQSKDLVHQGFMAMVLSLELSWGIVQGYYYWRYLQGNKLQTA